MTRPAAILAATALIAAPTAHADDLQWGRCPGGGQGWYGSQNVLRFGYCDGPVYEDGSYDHTVVAGGFWKESRVCPPDPANPLHPLPWIEGEVCQYDKYPQSENPTVDVPVLIPADSIPVEINEGQ